MDSHEISQNFAGIGALGGQLNKWADSPILKLLISPIAQKHNKLGGQIDAFLQADIDGRFIFLDEVVDGFSVSFVICYFIGGESGWFCNLTDERQQFGKGDDDGWPEYSLDMFYITVFGHVVWDG